jgi:hypothetical protein
MSILGAQNKRLRKNKDKHQKSEIRGPKSEGKRKIKESGGSYHLREAQILILPLKISA